VREEKERKPRKTTNTPGKSNSGRKLGDFEAALPFERKVYSFILVSPSHSHE
jgi:hypothetical protein